MTTLRGKNRKKAPIRATIVFLTRLDRFLSTASKKVSHLQIDEFEIPKWRATTSRTLTKLRRAVPKAKEAFQGLSGDEKNQVDRAIMDLGVLLLLADLHETMQHGSPDKTSLEVAGSIIIALGDFVGGFDAAKFFSGTLKAVGRFMVDIAKCMKDQAVDKLERKLDFIMDLPKAGEIPSGPEEGTPPVSLTLLKKKLDNLGDRLGEILIGQHIPIEPGENVPRFPDPIKREIQGLEREVGNLEKKLDFIMDLPAGVAPPPPPPAGTAPVSLTLLKTKLDNLADRLGEILTGRRIRIEPGGGTVPRPHPIKTEIEDLERKLDFIMDLPEGEKIPPPPPAGTPPVSLTQIKTEVEDLEKKLDFIMDLPKGKPIPPVPPRMTPVSLTEIKERIRDLEKKLDFIMDLPKGKPIPPVPPGVKPVSLTQIEKKLDFIMDLPKGKPIPPVPPGVKPVSLTQIEKKLDSVKRIFVAAEGTFAAASARTSRVIDIVAPAGGPPRFAFDLSGWINLSKMRQGDEMKVRLEVAVPSGGQLIVFTETTFVDAQAKGLKHFRDFADGVQAVVGTRARVTISQPVSADNYRTPLSVAFQFVIESP